MPASIRARSRSGVVVVIAVALIFGFEGEHAAGFAAGLGSAFFAAAFNLANARLSPHHDHRVIAGWEMVGACLLSAALLPLTSRWLSDGQGYDLRPDASDWFWLVLLALVCTVYSFSAYVGLLPAISAPTPSPSTRTSSRSSGSLSGSRSSTSTVISGRGSSWAWR